jgi:tetratricopeptide (TPR) repeat protein
MLRDLGKTFHLRPSCGRSAGLSSVLALLALSAFTRAAEVPLLALPAADAASAKPENRSLVAAVESSASAGLPSLAENLGEDALAKLPAGTSARRRVQIALATSRIQRSAYADAEKILREIPGDSADKSLRLSLVAYGLGKTSEARTHLAAAHKGALPPGDLVWRDVVEGLLAAETRRNDNDVAAEQFFNSAEAKAANNPLVLGQVALLRRRMQLRITQPDTDAFNELVKLIDLPDTRQTFQLAKVRAFAQYRAGNAMGAIAIMNSAPYVDTDLQAERDLLVGLMYGLGAPGNEGRHSDGRAALLRVVGAKEFPGSVEVKSAALAALCDAVLTAPQGEVVKNANAIYDALTSILQRQNSPLSKASDNTVADLIYYTRARIMLTAAKAAGGGDAGGAREKADDALRDLLEKFPDSRLRADTLRLTADLARQSGAFRKAADALDKLKELVPSDETDELRLVAADYYFLYGDWTNAAAGYAKARQNLRDETARGEALIGEVRSLIEDGRVVPDPAAPNDPRGNATKSLLEASASGARIPADARLRATWLLADALRKSGENVAATLRVNAALAASPDAGMRVRFLWLRAMIELSTDRNREAAATAAALAALVQNPTPDTPAEIRDNAPAILAQTALLKARALLGSGGVAGAESGFKELREKFPKAPSAAASYLVEGRYLSNKGFHAQALDVFKAGYDRFADEKSPELFDYAVASLFGAANEAITLADRKGPTKLNDSFDLLKELTKRLSELPPEKLEKSVFFRARLMQGDILRRINEFDSALKVYVDLIRQYPNNGDRFIAELARADCLTELGGSRTERYDEAAAEYERLVNFPGRPADLAAEASFKRANAAQAAAEARLNAALTAKTGDAATATRGAQQKREEAAKTLWQTTNDLLNTPAETAKLGQNGRHWIARGLLLISELHERNERTVDARAALQRLLDFNAGLKDGTRRLPGAELARERLKKLSGKTANPLPSP